MPCLLINISAVDVRWVHVSAHLPVFLNDRRDTEGDSMLILRSLGGSPALSGAGLCK